MLPRTATTSAAVGSGGCGGASVQPRWSMAAAGWLQWGRVGAVVPLCNPGAARLVGRRRSGPWAELLLEGGAAHREFVEHLAGVVGGRCAGGNDLDGERRDRRMSERHVSLAMSWISARIRFSSAVFASAMTVIMLGEVVPVEVSMRVMTLVTSGWSERSLRSCSRASSVSSTSCSLAHPTSSTAPSRPAASDMCSRGGHGCCRWMTWSAICPRRWRPPSPPARACSTAERRSERGRVSKVQETARVAVRYAASIRPGARGAPRSSAG